jgi:hypothetical protein
MSDDKSQLIELVKQEIRRRAAAPCFRYDESELLAIPDSGKVIVMLRSRIAAEIIADEYGNPTWEVRLVNRQLFFIQRTIGDARLDDRGRIAPDPMPKFISEADHLLFFIQDGVARGLDGTVITLPHAESEGAQT